MRIVQYIPGVMCWEGPSALPPGTEDWGIRLLVGAPVGVWGIGLTLDGVGGCKEEKD